jgi:uncharacterized protein (DUF983 family)
MTAATQPAPEVEFSIGKLTFRQAFQRGFRLRCPACSRGKLFRNWFQMHGCCSNCRFSYERPAGYFLGSTYINYGCTASLTTVTYVILLFGFGVARERLLPIALAFCVIFPLVFFRFARSLWLSLDCYFDRAGASEAMSGAGSIESRSEVTDKL